MLNAISNLFFGAKTVPAEEPVECQMKEDNEWLLVNIAGGKDPATKDDKLKSERKKSKKQKDAKTIENKSPKVIHEQLGVDELDEILTSVPSLMPLDKCDGYVDFTYCYPEESWVVASLFQKWTSDDFLGRCDKQVVLEELAMQTYIGLERLERCNVNNNKVTTPERKKRMAKPPAPYSVKSKSERVDKRQHHPAALSGAFASNLSPVHYSKSELLQQIKVLKPAQSAKDSEVKKFWKKLQMNRHNKTYLYESSNKNPHRRDLMQRHSGANNNRKCC